MVLSYLSRPRQSAPRMLVCDAYITHMAQRVNNYFCALVHISSCISGMATAIRAAPHTGLRHGVAVVRVTRATTPGVRA